MAERTGWWLAGARSVAWGRWALLAVLTVAVTSGCTSSRRLVVTANGARSGRFTEANARSPALS
jgi:hypothetical protein